MPLAEFYMRQCLQLALKGKGSTAPNPMVGAVLVHNDRIISEGFHHLHGGDHAEVDCLKNVKPADLPLLPFSTMYVNLEPCAHHGLTPPCAIRIIEAGLQKVVIANLDPNPLVAGKGVQLLQQAGIETEVGLGSDEGLWLNRRFFCFYTSNRPYIILKWAQDQNRFSAPANRVRLQLTGTAAQILVHQWRTEESAILVGTKTALSDNPQLTARLVAGRQPLRIALDRSLIIPQHYHLLDQSVPTWIVNEKEETQRGNLQFVKTGFGPELIPGLLDRLRKYKIISLLVEGGSETLRNFIEPGLWDEARVFTTPATIEEGLPAPVLPGACLAQSSFIGPDRLDIFTSPANRYPFHQGLD